MFEKDKFLQLPLEFIVTQTLDFINSKKVIKEFSYQHKILKVSGDNDFAKITGLNEIFNSDFGLTTSKFIDLKTEELRQKQFDKSLTNIKENFDNNNLSQLIECYVDIANADDFIHENEVSLINRAIEVWNLDFKVGKPKSGKKLKLKK